MIEQTPNLGLWKPDTSLPGRQLTEGFTDDGKGLLYDNNRKLAAVAKLDDWTDWTPTLSDNISGVSSALGRYRLLTLDYLTGYAAIFFSSSATSTVGNYKISLPKPAPPVAGVGWIVLGINFDDYFYYSSVLVSDETGEEAYIMDNVIGGDTADNPYFRYSVEEDMSFIQPSDRWVMQLSYRVVPDA